MSAPDKGPDKGPDVKAELQRDAVHAADAVLLASDYYGLSMRLDGTVRDMLEVAWLRGYQAAVEAQREAFNTALAGLIGERP